mmetsp:Transcript_2372/g.5573  ORF Transcript_2372/g.5573 Transcript_2372/m.5573 type:complete len:263 (+) Transcript_2372:843-1631(+)
MGTTLRRPLERRICRPCLPYAPDRSRISSCLQGRLRLCEGSAEGRCYVCWARRRTVCRALLSCSCSRLSHADPSHTRLSLAQYFSSSARTRQGQAWWCKPVEGCRSSDVVSRYDSDFLSLAHFHIYLNSEKNIDGNDPPHRHQAACSRASCSSLATAASSSQTPSSPQTLPSPSPRLLASLRPASRLRTSRVRLGRASALCASLRSGRPCLLAAAFFHRIHWDPNSAHHRGARAIPVRSAARVASLGCRASQASKRAGSGLC